MKLKKVPNFISASSPKGLRRLMFKNNLVRGLKFHYFDIQWNQQEKKWYAWFEDEANPEIQKEVKHDD